MKWSPLKSQIKTVEFEEYGETVIDSECQDQDDRGGENDDITIKKTGLLMIPFRDPLLYRLKSICLVHLLFGTLKEGII